MIHGEHIIQITKLNLKLHWQSHVYAIRVMRIYLLKKLKHSQTQQPQPQVMPMKKIIKNCVSFTYCISEINNTQVDNAKHNDVVITIIMVLIRLILKKK